MTDIYQLALPAWAYEWVGNIDSHLLGIEPDDVQVMGQLLVIHKSNNQFVCRNYKDVCRIREEILNAEWEKRKLTSTFAESINESIKLELQELEQQRERLEQELSKVDNQIYKLRAYESVAKIGVE